MKIQNGLYHYTGDSGGIDIEVKETDKSFIFILVKNSCRYSPAHIDMLFNRSNRAVIKKQGGEHAMRFDNYGDNYFVLYPFRAGIPFLFELVKEDN